jgi:DNA adenine methylase
MRSKELQRPILRYHGGKWLKGKWIISHFPKHRVYVEGFGGGGSVLMQKVRSYAEVYNDKWDIVWNVFHVVRDREMATELERRIRLTPYSRKEFSQCGDIDLRKIADPIEKARLTIFRSFAGFGSASTNAKYSTGFRANSNRSGTTPAQDWLNYPNHINAFTERLQGVVIENKDYREVIDQHDSKETLIYLDPPYVHSTRNMQRGNAAYACEMIDQDHIDMAERVNRVKGMCIISGYGNELYQDLFKDWKLIRSKAYADGAAERIECLWLNKNAYQHSNLLF